MISFTSLTFPWQLAGFAGFTLGVKLLPEATPRLLKINELDTVKAQEFLASSCTIQHIMVF